MNSKSLMNWLSDPRLLLSQAVTHCICNHARKLQSKGIQFYGYALLPGDSYDINSIVAAYNCEPDIMTSQNDAPYPYYKFSVDEWSHFDRAEYEQANKQLVELNCKFASLHSKDEDDFTMDEYEILHARTQLEYILRGFEVAKAAGVFGTTNPFLAIWLPDSSHKIILESVRRLNSIETADLFEAHFG